MRMKAIWSLVALLLLALIPAQALAVDLSLGKREVKPTGDGERITQPVTIANTINSYTLTWDAAASAENPNLVTAASWGWTVGWVPLGMTAPSQSNWYYQGFFNWYFDDESLHMYVPTWRVVRGYGPDAMIEYSWDLPAARVWLRFAMVEGSDKLLMFGGYEPKREVQRCWMRFVCYPSFFPEPRERAVTTALGTRRPGESLDLNFEQERWVLYEDTSEGREGAGSAGMILGTPQAFSSVTIPVGAYGIETRIELKAAERRWAVALYDFPPLPDYRQTREYFARLGDAEAAALQEIAAGDLDQPLGEMPRDEERIARVLAQGAEMFDRPAEIWRPNPEPLDFSWARELPGEPIKSVLFCPRWQAWESMELARRLELDVDHLYFDGRDELSNPSAWPYASATGIGPIPFGVASMRANAMVEGEETDLYLSAGLNANAIPGVTRIKIMEQVASGKGLLISGSNAAWQGWPKELLAAPDQELTERILGGLDWHAIPGFEEGGVGHADADHPPVRAYRYGEGRVVVLALRLTHFGCFTPSNSLTEGIMGAMDRMLALVARAAMFAAGREPRCEVGLAPGEMAAGTLPITLTPAPPGNSEFRWRVQDDLERTVGAGTVEGPGAQASISLPPLPPSRRCWLDAAVYDAQGEVLGFSFAELPAGDGPRVSGLSIEPSTLTHELSVPWVKLPDGGELQCSATLEGAAPAGAVLHWEVSDAIGRVLARADTPAQARSQVTLPLSRPMTVCHLLDVTLRAGDRTLDFARQRFTNPPPYPYDDFTGLMWNTCSETPSLLITDRLCYEWGADMCDPANTVGADDARCARQFALRARSGMRLVPYATRVFGEAVADNMRTPCLHDPNYVAAQQGYLTANGRQGAPYAPAAYTLGDENYLDRKGGGEPCYSEHTLAAFRDWLQARYGTVARLNEVWGSNWRSFDEVVPPLIGGAAELPGNWAGWFDHKLFMDQSFTGTHDWMRETIRAQDPQAKVGWDGLLGYHWQAGYDFADLTANCDLNQVYVGQWVQGELVRSFAREDALVGKWGNRVANNEAGWTAYPWHCLFDGCNSAWWWTSWGCDYTPFNPDISQSKFGEWFFRALREVNSGPGKLLVNAERDDSGVAILYSQMDTFAAAMAAQLVAGDSSFRDDSGLLGAHEAVLKGVHDVGRQFVYVTAEDVARGRISARRFPVLILSLASCLSDEQVAAIRDYVAAGGTLLVDGRAGHLDGRGNVRETRALDEVLGVTGAAGVEGFRQPTAKGALVATDELAEGLSGVEVEVLEPGLVVTTGRAAAEVAGVPVLITNSLGQGRAITLNLSLKPLLAQRAQPGPQPWLAMIDRILTGAGVEPYCRLTCEGGDRPLCIMQALFTDGPARYLCLEQDLLQYGLPDQAIHVRLPEPSIVYDVRAGRRIGAGRVSEWDTTLGRGDPKVYALLPYEVTAVTLQAPGQAAVGDTIAVGASVHTSARAGYHVVRLDVFAPGSDAPHRQYSQNIACNRGAGRTTIPFALSDPKGQWRLVARDAASGVTTEAKLTLR